MEEIAPTSSFACPALVIKSAIMFTTDTSARVTKVMSCMTRQSAKILTNAAQTNPAT